MVNLADMTLEELRQLALTAANVDKKDPNAVRRLQELAGLTGKDVDGIFGPKTLNAWNESISQATGDEQRFQDAMARGQKSPAVEDILGYSEQLDEQNRYRNEKIAQLEQQIAMVKARIARNTRALTGKSYDDVNNKLAALEMKKINSQDPSMLWRWQNQRQDTMNANAAVNANTANKFVNEVEALTKTSISPDYAEQVQLLNNVRNKIAEGKTLGYDVSGLEEMEKAIQDKVDETYRNIEAVKTIRNKLKNLDQQLADKTITPALYTASVNMLKGADFDDDELRYELNTKSMLGSKKEKANTNEAAVKNWYENEHGKGSWGQLSERVKAAYRNAYNAENGVK